MTNFNGEKPPNGLSEVDARLIISELATIRQANLRLIRELEQIRHNTERNETLLRSTRAELCEVRATIRNTEAHARGEPSPVARLIQTVTYKPPKPHTQVLEKESRERAGPRIFDNGHEVLGGKITHTVRARTATGALVELPTSYDQAHKFLSMPTPNRRLHWRGKRDVYTVMLALSLRAGFIERRGRGFAWVERYDLLGRMSWLSQFRPPLRVR